CLGMQFVNVAAGGTLYQDIPDQIGEDVNHARGNYHPVQIVAGSHLAERLGSTEAEVYSSHHQAVQDVADGFEVVAVSSDGIIESLERTEGGWGLCVQWHPEAMSNEEHRRAIYGALIEASRK
ncbi:MAG: gamma-glutamyl-gamma-aminobutyrate hydrolase family protein, partial [Planctomycetes bacterium]|nr:gamma-glutamyl-gamma-aminobutyrate hydrolase family protein [Planctomycetota bacterium]